MDRHVVARVAFEAHLRAVLGLEIPDVPVIVRMRQDAIRHLVERRYNRIRFFRRIATRCDKLGSTCFTMVKLAAIEI